MKIDWPKLEICWVMWEELYVIIHNNSYVIESVQCSVAESCVQIDHFWEGIKEHHRKKNDVEEFDWFLSLDRNRIKILKEFSPIINLKE